MRIADHENISRGSCEIAQFQKTLERRAKNAIYWKYGPTTDSKTRGMGMNGY